MSNTEQASSDPVQIPKSSKEQIDNIGNKLEKSSNILEELKQRGALLLREVLNDKKERENDANTNSTEQY